MISLSRTNHLLAIDTEVLPFLFGLVMTTPGNRRHHLRPAGLHGQLAEVDVARLSSVTSWQRRTFSTLGAMLSTFL